MTIILDEVLLWDGSISKGRKRYFSKHKSDCDVVQYMAARLGIRSTISEDIREGRNTVYATQFSSEKSSSISLSKNPSIKPFKTKDGFKYCFTMPKGFLVLRRNGRIFVTGNSGKNHGLEYIKQTYMEINAQKLLIAGDIGSDAGITDNLASKPQCLYIMDEMGGILKSINKGQGEFSSKIADILAELYTCSNSAYLGRTLKEGIVGSCDRPNVNILGATTPTGLKEGFSKSSLEKGLMGRFLVFQGDPYQKSQRVFKEQPLDRDIINNLQWLASYVPNSTDTKLSTRPQLVTELKATEDANALLDKIFLEFDDLRIKHIMNTESPIVARLYQQLVKLTIVSATANANRQVPQIRLQDVQFAYTVIQHYFSTLKELVSDNIFDSRQQKEKSEMLQLIKQYGTINKQDLVRLTQQFTASQRNAVLDDLLEAGLIIKMANNENNKLNLYFKAV